MNLPTMGKKETVKGGEIITRMLAAEGVKKVFGIIDGTYIGMFAKFEENGIDFITPRHETCAAHMAGAYARLTGRLGVCIASNGPGVANILPGVAVENAEGNRVLLITSTRRDPIIYPDRGGTFQYFPQVDVTAPMTKWSCAVKSVDRVAEVMRRALRISYTGRPGVVHIDVPENIMNGGFEVDPTWFREPKSYRPLHPLTPAPDQVDTAVRMLLAAEKPAIHAGSGVLHAAAYTELMELAELIEAPITTSWGARAVADERKPRVIPMPYIDAVNKARSQSDVILVLGSRLGETDWWGKAPYWGKPDEQKTIQVDIDGENLGNVRAADLAVQADCKQFMRLVIDALRDRPHPDFAKRREFVAELAEACQSRRKKLDKNLRDQSAPMNPAHVATVCRRIFDDDAVLVIDGGNTAVWTNFFHEVRTPNTVLSTAKMGMLGAGVSQTLGAKVAHPNRQVYCIIGDGAMGFHMQEIETAVRNKLQVTFLVLCDRQWGMVKMTQQIAFKPIKTLLLKSLGPGETINADLSEIQFDQLARAMGAHGERVADPNGLEGAIKRSLASRRCSVIHVDVNQVKHMWAPSLKAFKDLHAEPKG
jgi:acetolactate synthase-1/2/3 large subunit